MMAASHLIFGAASWSVLCRILDLPAADPVDLGAAALGALLPDVDHPGSALGRKIPWISGPLAAVVGHRGVTHSLVAVAGCAAIGYMWGGVLITGPLVVGYLSHLLADSLTLSGIPLLWPNRKVFGIPLCRTGDWRELSLTAGVAAVGAWAAGLPLDPHTLMKSVDHIKGWP